MNSQRSRRVKPELINLEELDNGKLTLPALHIDPIWPPHMRKKRAMRSFKDIVKRKRIMIKFLSVNPPPTPPRVQFDVKDLDNVLTMLDRFKIIEERQNRTLKRIKSNAAQNSFNKKINKTEQTNLGVMLNAKPTALQKTVMKDTILKEKGFFKVTRKSMNGARKDEKEPSDGIHKRLRPKLCGRNINVKKRQKRQQKQQHPPLHQEQRQQTQTCKQQSKLDESKNRFPNLAPKYSSRDTISSTKTQAVLTNSVKSNKLTRQLVVLNADRKVRNVGQLTELEDPQLELESTTNTQQTQLNCEDTLTTQQNNDKKLQLQLKRKHKSKQRKRVNKSVGRQSEVKDSRDKVRIIPLQPLNDPRFVRLQQTLVRPEDSETLIKEHNWSRYYWISK